MAKALITDGSLVKYRHKVNNGVHGDARHGLVVKILSKFERDDNILVMWNDGRQWCVKSDWIELV